jgi:hypothetical protein
MSDVNYLEYGENALRVSNSGVDITSFLADNGYFLGVLLAIIILLGFALFILFWLIKNFRRVFS